MAASLHTTRCTGRRVTDTVRPTHSLHCLGMLTGLNHLTLAVCDLQRSVQFYRDVLACACHAQWDTGAYLSVGDFWLCLSLDPARNSAPSAARDYTHYAFGIEQQHFADFVVHAQKHGVIAWKNNRSEGDSFYFLDPDGHQLEVHVGSLASRIAQCKAAPYAGMRFGDVQACHTSNAPIKT